MAKSLEALHEIASRSREEFESSMISDEFLSELIDRYVPDNAETWKLSLPLARPKFPNFNCGFTAVYLRDRVGFGEVVNGHYENKLHTFLDIGSTAISATTIIDITADQFGGPKIYIGNLEDPWSK